MAYSVARGIGFGDTEGLGVQWVVEFVVEGVDKVVLLQEHACSWPAADRGRQYATPLPGVELFDKSDAEVDVGVGAAVLPRTPPAGSGHYVTVVDLAPVGFDPLGGWLRWWQSFGIRAAGGGWRLLRMGRIKTRLERLRDLMNVSNRIQYASTSQFAQGLQAK
jgi:hypothetical protein